MSSQFDRNHRACVLARQCFLSENYFYGCAETTFVVLKHEYKLSDENDSSCVMVLNGGFARCGSTCGALLAGAIAVGMLTGIRIKDHYKAKQISRRIIQKLVVEFNSFFSSTDCRELINQDIWTEEQHKDFIDKGMWRKTCMEQIEFVVAYLAPLSDEQYWQEFLIDLNQENKS